MRKKQLKLPKLEMLNDWVFQVNGVYHRAILKVSGINLEILTDSERETVYDKFKEILNGIDNIQLYTEIKSANFEVKRYQTENDALREYEEEYHKHNQQFYGDSLAHFNYIIVESWQPAPQVYTELNAKLDFLTGSFADIGVYCETVMGDDLDRLITYPDFVKCHKDHAIYGDKYCYLYEVVSYPDMASVGWQLPLLNFKGHLAVTTHIQKHGNKSEITQTLKKAKAKIESALIHYSKNKWLEPTDLEPKRQSVNHLIASLEEGGENVFEAKQIIMLMADSLEGLNEQKLLLEYQLESMSIEVRSFYFDTVKGLISSLPIGMNQLEKPYYFETTSLGTFFPFVVEELHPEGHILGRDTRFNSVVMLNRWKQLNPNLIVLGASGSGKSYLTKKEAAICLLDGYQVIAIDHGGEWEDFCHAFNGIFTMAQEKEGQYSLQIKPEDDLVVIGGDKTEGLLALMNYAQEYPVTRPILVVLEECHTFLLNPEDSRILVSGTKMLRKKGCALMPITQNANDFLRSYDGQAIFDNCELKILMKQGDNDLQAIRAIYKLSEKEERFLKSAKHGEGIFIQQLGRVRFKSEKMGIDDRYFDTDPSKRFTVKKEGTK